MPSMNRSCLARRMRRIDSSARIPMRPCSRHCAIGKRRKSNNNNSSSSNHSSNHSSRVRCSREVRRRLGLHHQLAVGLGPLHLARPHLHRRRARLERAPHRLLRLRLERRRRLAHPLLRHPHSLHNQQRRQHLEPHLHRRHQRAHSASSLDRPSVQDQHSVVRAHSARTKSKTPTRATCPVAVI